MSPYLSSPTSTNGDGQTSTRHDPFKQLENDPAVLPSSLDPFTITTSTGFLPLHPPSTKLPTAFHALADIVDYMPIAKVDGTPGLLATYALGPTIDNGALPNLTMELDKLVTGDGLPDLSEVTAIFRDYAFLASAYLLEPCWERWNKGLEGYGLGREMLPACIAGPLVKSANL